MHRDYCFLTFGYQKDAYLIVMGILDDLDESFASGSTSADASASSTAPVGSKAALKEALLKARARQDDDMSGRRTSQRKQAKTQSFR